MNRPTVVPENFRRGDPDHRQFLAAHANRLTDDLGVRIEMPLPHALADDRHRIFAWRVFLLLGPEEPARRPA